jgi:hypothetical protein
VIGAVDGSHIPIIAPNLDPVSYYYRKGFYSTLVQSIVDSKCRFRDYDFDGLGVVTTGLSFKMVVERAFGILKGRWIIILKRVNMPLHHLPNLIRTCICLHNLCIIHKDNFDNSWAKLSEKLTQEKSTVQLGQIEILGILLAVAQATKKCIEI